MYQFFFFFLCDWINLTNWAFFIYLTVQFQVLIKHKTVDRYFNCPFLLSDCPNIVGNQVIVIASSFRYNSSGEFACSNGGIMFYANESLVNLKSTRCLFSAKWRDEDSVQCWSGMLRCWLQKCLNLHKLLCSLKLAFSLAILHLKIFKMFFTFLLQLYLLVINKLRLIRMV